jgi:hypothetical protein
VNAIFPAEWDYSSDNVPLSAARKNSICSGFQGEGVSILKPGGRSEAICEGIGGSRTEDRFCARPARCSLIRNEPHTGQGYGCCSHGRGESKWGASGGAGEATRSWLTKSLTDS